MDRDVDGRRIGDAARAAPSSIDGVDGRRRPWRRQEAGQAGRAAPRWTACRGGAGRGAARHRRCGTRCGRRRVARRGCSPGGRRDRARARRSARRSLPFGGPRQRLETDERDRHLEPGEPVAGRTRSARRRPGPARRRGGRWPRRPRARTSASRRATTPASAMAGWSRRTASTSDGEMFSPPRTIRSVRRSATVSRPSSSRLPRSPVRSQPSSVRVAAVAAGRRGSRRTVAGLRTSISPMPSVVRRRRSGARPRGVPGRHCRDGRAASSVGSAVTPDPASVRPYVGTTGQPASSARRTRPAGWGRHPAGQPEGSLAAARRRSRRGSGPASRRDERDVARARDPRPGRATIAAGVRPLQDDERDARQARPATRRRCRRHDQVRRPAANPSPAAGPRATTRRWRRARRSTGWQPSVDRSSRGQDRERRRGRIGGGRSGVALRGAVDQRLEPEHRSGQAQRRFLEPGARDHDPRREDLGRGGQLATRQAGPDGRSDRPDAGDPVEDGDRRRGGRTRAARLGRPARRRRSSNPSATASARRSSSAHVHRSTHP